MLVYGAAGLAGIVIAVATVVLTVTGTGLVAVVGLLILWGAAYGAVPACSQTWLAWASDGADEAATVLFTSSFQATISIAALLGGAAAAVTVGLVTESSGS